MPIPRVVPLRVDARRPPQIIAYLGETAHNLVDCADGPGGSDESTSGARVAIGGGAVLGGWWLRSARRWLEDTVAELAAIERELEVGQRGTGG